MSIIKSGNKLNYEKGIEVFQVIPKGNYNLNFDFNTNQCFLTEKEAFTLPSKIYGDLEIAESALYRFKNRNKNLGVYLVGESGSGKTLTAKYIAQKADLTTIFITNNSFKISVFIEWISSIEQDLCLFFDEWEKIFPDKAEQNKFLSLLDGVFNSSQYKRLFLFTSNEEVMSPYMKNRPSRVFYKKLYQYISIEEYEELLKDSKLNDKQKESLTEFLENLEFKFNIDTVFSIIDELTLFGSEDVNKTVQLLNISLPQLTYDIEWHYKNYKFNYSTIVTDLNFKNQRSIYVNCKMDYEKTCKILGLEPYEESTDKVVEQDGFYFEDLEKQEDGSMKLIIRNHNEHLSGNYFLKRVVKPVIKSFNSQIILS